MVTRTFLTRVKTASLESGFDSPPSHQADATPPTGHLTHLDLTLLNLTPLDLTPLDMIPLDPTPLDPTPLDLTPLDQIPRSTTGINAHVHTPKGRHAQNIIKTN